MNLRHHWPLLLIVAIFLAATFAQSRLLPLMEGGDEILHTAYVEHLRTTFQLPDRTTNATNCTRQESGQPPLTYVLAALLLNAAQRPHINCDQLRADYDNRQNPWLSQPDQWLRGDNARVSIPPDTNLPPAYRTNVYLMRATAPVWGLLAVVGAYAAGLTVFHRRRLALLTATVFAFTPQFIHLSSYFNNDISSIAFATLLLWRTLLVLRRPVTTTDPILLGILSGLGALAKMSVGLLLPAVGLALLFEALRHLQPLRRLLRSGLIYSVTLLVVLGPWLLFGLLTYGDPLGTNTHFNPAYYHDPPRPLMAVMADLDKIFLTYLGNFGLSKVLLQPFTYFVLGIAAATAVLGHIVGIRRRTLQANYLQIAVLLVAVLVFVAGFYRWYTTVFFVTGRLLHPIHLIFALFLVAGWQQLNGRWWLLAWGAALFMTSGALLTPLAIHDAYQRPVYVAAPIVTGPQYDFDNTIRFLGYDLKQERIARGGLAMDLCWEILKSPERRAAFSVKLVRDGEILADRTSLFGLGNYDSTLWNPDHRFCDHVYIPVNDPDVPAAQEAPFRRDTVYDILIVVLDADTFAVDWQATHLDGTPVQFPFVGQVSTIP